MKKFIFTCFLMMGTTLLFAQEPVQPAGETPAGKQSNTNVTRKVAMKSYCCPGCDFVSQKPGTCPHDNKTLIREGMYYCADGATSREPAKCADGTAMIIMVDKTKKAVDDKPAEPAK